MSSIPSADAKAVVRAVEGLSTQVRRVADALTTPVVRNEVVADDDATTAVYCPLCPDAPRLFTPTDATDHFRTKHPEQRLVDGPWPLLVPPDEWAPAADAPTTVAHWLPMSEHATEEKQELADMVGQFIEAQVQQAPAADEDAQRTARRDSLRNLIDHLDRKGALAYDEGALLREHTEAEMREHDTMRSVAAGNKRHVQMMYADLQHHRGGHEAWKAKAEEIERDRDKYARSEAEEQARADIAERDLRTLRTGLRAAGGDPTQIQNLWAQIRLRNRQWREAKREAALTRSLLEEEGGDVALVDEMIATVAKAEGEAREAQAAIERVRAEGERLHAASVLADGEPHTDRERGIVAAVARVLAALDGTEQPTTEA